MLFVITKDRNKFENFRRANGYSFSEVIFVKSIKDVLGKTKPKDEYVVLGNYDYEKFDEAIGYLKSRRVLGSSKLFNY